jgi:uncharacterized protein (TIGR02596 family)
MKRPRLSSRARSSAAAAFTLIEILVVVALIAMLLAISGLGLGNSISSMQLSAAANGLSGTLNHAALLARRENRPVQVRFYKFATAENPDARFRAYQLAMMDGINPDGSASIQLLSEIHQLPSGVVMSPDARFNTLAGQAEQTPGASDPSFGPNYTFASYEIRPDGLTTLPKNEPGVITLFLEGHKPEASGLPANFRAVVLNSLNARARIY